jgi:hypothetical protein
LAGNGLLSLSAGRRLLVPVNAFEVCGSIICWFGGLSSADSRVLFKLEK